ncbi:MAG: hypothetical protein R3C53_11810 [Pirellulaceae bacterium]
MVQRHLRIWLWFGLIASCSLSVMQVAIAQNADHSRLIAEYPDAGSPPMPLEQVEPQQQFAAENTAEDAPVLDSDQQGSHANAPPAEVPSDDQLEPVVAPSTPGVAEVTELLDEPTAQVRELSVEPGSRPLLPDDLPAWTTAAPDFSSSTHYFVVSSLPTSTLDEVDEALDEPLLAAVEDYIEHQLVHEDYASFDMRSQITVDYIRRNLINEPAGYVAELSTSNGPMYQKWVSVSVSQPQQQQFRSWYRAAQQRKRMVPLAVGLLALLAGVSVMHLVLRRVSASSLTGSGKFTAMTGGEPRLQLPVAQPMRRRCCSKLGSLAMLAAITVGILIFIRLARTENQAIEAPALRVSGDSVAESRMSGVTPIKPVRPESVPTALRESSREVKLTRGNQVIIIRSE